MLRDAFFSFLRAATDKKPSAMLQKCFFMKKVFSEVFLQNVKNGSSLFLISENFLQLPFFSF